MTNKQLVDLVAGNSDILRLNKITCTVPKEDTVLLVSAMEEEYQSLLRALEFLHISYNNVFVSKYNRYICEFIMSYPGSHKVRYLATWIGITFFTSPVLKDFISFYAPDMVLHFGTCASIVGAPFCKVIPSNNTYCTDLDLTMFGRIDGTIDKVTRSFDVKGPKILSGSKFLSSKSLMMRMRKRFPGAVAFDMETFMFHEVCIQSGVPYFSLKAVSDSGSSDDFEANLEMASFISALYALSFLGHGGVSSIASK